MNSTETTPIPARRNAEQVFKVNSRRFYRIGEAARIVGVQPHVLRFWESEFGAVHVERSKSGQRVYSAAAVERLQWIRQLLYVEGFTIAGARRVLSRGLRDPGVVE